LQNGIATERSKAIIVISLQAEKDNISTLERIFRDFERGGGTWNIGVTSPLYWYLHTVPGVQSFNLLVHVKSKIAVIVKSCFDQLKDSQV
jgi:hypothetical protein